MLQVKQRLPGSLQELGDIIPWCVLGRRFMQILRLDSTAVILLWGRWISTFHCVLAVSTWILHLALGSSAQEGLRLLGVSSEEGHQDDWMDGAPLHWGKAESIEIVLPGKKRLHGNLIVWPSNSWRKTTRKINFLQQHVLTRQVTMASNWRRFRFDKILYWEGGEAMEQVDQRICGCPIPESV